MQAQTTNSFFFPFPILVRKNAHKSQPPRTLLQIHLFSQEKSSPLKACFCPGAPGAGTLPLSLEQQRTHTEDDANPPALAPFRLEMPPWSLTCHRWASSLPGPSPSSVALPKIQVASILHQNINGHILRQTFVLPGAMNNVNSTYLKS